MVLNSCHFKTLFAFFTNHYHFVLSAQTAVRFILCFLHLVLRGAAAGRASEDDDDLRLDFCT